MNIIDLLIKAGIIVSMILIRIYWRAAEEEADMKIPSTSTRRTRFRNQFRAIEIAFYIVLLIQCFVYPILPFNPSIVTQALGLVLFVSGVRISVSGRTALAENWNHLIDYQVKEKQELVTDGVYRLVRHPIYAGFWFMLTAIEILLHSWLFIVVGLGVFVFIYLQSVKEESILARHFGKEYLKYMHRSKMFIPYIF
ncbi:isoprenylcysteine carboxylmethyltransferase family protein [Candidatus Microgenomates bacterium]|nr:isoprenylcysteine carboxylmethyltransferase family protein [Candidatus Microgenomates bacterium]